MPDFSDSERRILSYFEMGSKIFFKGKEWEVVEADKPTCPHGEPKTDIFIRVDNGREYEDIKISNKQENADFLENKTTPERAEDLLGPDWREIIKESTNSVADKFYAKDLIFKEKYKRSEKGAMTLGWRYELLDKPGGELSGRLDLSPQQIYDVYAGTSLPEEKKNAYVNGRIIPNSGIADYVLRNDNVSSAQEVIDCMLPVDEYIRLHPYVYFACKALNYRTFKDKYEGNRCLAVQVAWHIDNGKLCADLIFDSPLEIRGRQVAERLFECLDYLDIATTDDINDDNTDMDNVHE